MSTVRAQPVDSQTGASRRADAVSERRLWFVVFGFIAAGLIITLSNATLPVVRNAICYAKAAVGIVQHGFNVFAIARDTAWTSGKPILFSILAAPFVWLTDANTGTLIASFLGTTFFLSMVALALLRLNRRLGIDQSSTWLEFVLVAGNPLVLYQFWSGYPDSLFAGFVVLAFVLVDIIATEPERDTRWHIVCLGATICLAIHTKLYGAVLGLACPLYMLMHGPAFLARSSYLIAKVSLLAVVFAALALLLVVAKLGIYPLLAFEEGGGFAVFIDGILGVEDSVFLPSVLMLGFAILLSFHVALLFIGTPQARSAWAWPPTVFMLIYLAGLLTFEGTPQNMRYFLPIFPFLAPNLAAGMRSVRPTGRAVVLSSYAVIACTLVGVFNVAALEPLIDPIAAQAAERNGLLKLWLDNLRLPVQMALKRQLDFVNASIPDQSTLIWSSDYYDTATHGLALDLGIKQNLKIQYVETPAQIRAPSEPVYLVVPGIQQIPATLQQVPDWATVQNLGQGLFRLDPIAIGLTSKSGLYVPEGGSIRLRGELTTGDRFKASVGTVQFLDGNEDIGTASRQPFELTLPNPTPGRHSIIARAGYGEPNAVTSRPLVVYVGVLAAEWYARSAGDLAHERRDRTVEPEVNVLEMGGDASTTGIYFDGISLQPGTRISEAYLLMTTAGLQLEPTSLEFQAERSGSAAPIKFEEPADLSRRPRTVARVQWNPPPWASDGATVRTPDLSSILQEVLDQPGWQPGNGLLLLIHGSRRRTAALPDPGTQNAPRLYVELK